MSNLIPEPMSKLIDVFSRLPGVGPNTASRLTYFLLSQPDISEGLATALRDMKSNTHFCPVCCNIMVNDLCPICGDPRRDPHRIMVVEMPHDLLTIEQTGSYNGLYHVLHGAISPAKSIGPDKLRIRELVERVEMGEVSEVIIATNPGQEGDATAMFIQKYSLAGKGIKITRLHSSGLS
jgi:recombination protein RecR